MSVPLPAELADAEVSGAASNALCQLCEDCGAKLAPFLQTLMALYQRVTSAGQASTPESGPPSSLEEDSIQQACSLASEVLSGPCICVLSPWTFQAVHAHAPFLFNFWT